jgi:D-alanine-D-alanine ligase
MKKILIVTGPGGDAQGWGDIKVTRTMSEILNQIGVAAEIAYVETVDEFNRAINNSAYDIVWSALYYLSSRADIIAIAEDAAWVADLLDDKQIPYIGSNAETMKNLIKKFDTHRIMHSFGVPVPEHHLAGINQPLPQVRFPAFVKPNGESRSTGISDESVVHNPEELAKRVSYIHHKLEQDALIEDFLPGDEYTVLMLGNGAHQEILPGLVTIEKSHYGKYNILRSDLRGVGLTKISIPAEERAREAIELTRNATQALNCLDHVRVDLRVGADGALRVIEINGIPGLKPVKSWSPQIYSLYHPSPSAAMDEYKNMLKVIVSSAFARIGDAMR